MNARLAAVLLALAVHTVAAEMPGRAVAVTIDDLPKVGGDQSALGVATTTRALLTSMAAHEVRALGFVTTQRVLVATQIDARMEALRSWVVAGHSLGNHTYSHADSSTIEPWRFLDDAVKGDVIPRLLMTEAGRQVRYFRHPFNHTGPTREARDGFANAMLVRGYTIAPFTIEHADYIFDRLYVDAVERHDSPAAERVRVAYLEQLDTAFDSAESLTRATFGRDIPQVLLIHANSINAVCLDTMLSRLAVRGYSFVSLEKALEDPAFATDDGYLGAAGISWLHRWRIALGLEDRLREEPDPPRWVLEQFRALSHGP